MSSPRVLIIGGGVGGLALAQGLRKNGISFTIFERDPSPVSRAQGYRIRIAGAGADSLHDCLDGQTWDLFERTCADIKFGGSRFDAINGEPVPPQGPAGPGGAEAFRGGSGGTSGPGKAASAYTVDRTLLRALLLLGQEPHVKFGKSFERYELTATGVTAFFSDGTREDGSLLVGAEGVASPVRKQFLPNQKYVDTGSRVIYGKSPFTPELERRFPAEALKWVTVIQDKQPLTLFLEPIRFPRDASIESQGRLLKTDNYVYWVLGGSTEDFGIPDEEFHTLSHKAAADLTIQLTNHWDPAFRSMLELQSVDQCAPLRLISAKPKRPDVRISRNKYLPTPECFMSLRHCP